MCYFGFSLSSGWPAGLLPWATLYQDTVGSSAASLELSLTISLAVKPFIFSALSDSTCFPFVGNCCKWQAKAKTVCSALRTVLSLDANEILEYHQWPLVLLITFKAGFMVASLQVGPGYSHRITTDRQTANISFPGEDGSFGR